jgi:hypothetical protein
MAASFREDISMATLSQLAGVAIDDLENVQISDPLYKGLRVLIKVSDYQLDDLGTLLMAIDILNELMVTYKNQQTEHHDDLKREILGRIREYEAKVTRLQSKPKSVWLFESRH